MPEPTEPDERMGLLLFALYLGVGLVCAVVAALVIGWWS